MEKGLKFTSEMVVEERHLAKSVGSGDLPVLGTPVMMSLMENAAMNAVSASLAEGESTVGSYIEASHIRPTALGDTVCATATLTAVEGRKLTFRVEAADSKGNIGEGSHVRYIINIEKFLAKMSGKG